MKKLLLGLVLLIGLCAHSGFNDVVPVRVSTANPGTIGVYQAAGDIIIYNQPAKNAKIIQTIDWGSVVPEMFVVYIGSKGLAFFPVTDEKDGWLEIIYDSLTGDKGWIVKNDPDRFLSWLSFYNIYGKKYGLQLLGGVPETTKNLYSAPDEFSKVVGRIPQPQKINLTAIRGNWALVSVYDIDKVPKTGYIRWRADNGVKYLFPALQ